MNYENHKEEISKTREPRWLRFDERGLRILVYGSSLLWFLLVILIWRIRLSFSLSKDDLGVISQVTGGFAAICFGLIGLDIIKRDKYGLLSSLILSASFSMTSFLSLLTELRFSPGGLAIIDFEAVLIVGIWSLVCLVLDAVSRIFRRRRTTRIREPPVVWMLQPILVGISLIKQRTLLQGVLTLLVGSISYFIGSILVLSWLLWRTAGMDLAGKVLDILSEGWRKPMRAGDIFAELQLRGITTTQEKVLEALEVLVEEGIVTEIRRGEYAIAPDLHFLRRSFENDVIIMPAEYDDEMIANLLKIDVLLFKRYISPALNEVFRSRRSRNYYCFLGVKVANLPPRERLRRAKYTVALSESEIFYGSPWDMESKFLEKVLKFEIPEELDSISKVVEEIGKFLEKEVKHDPNEGPVTCICSPKKHFLLMDDSNMLTVEFMLLLLPFNVLLKSEKIASLLLKEEPAYRLLEFVFEYFHKNNIMLLEIKWTRSLYEPEYNRVTVGLVEDIHNPPVRAREISCKGVPSNCEIRLREILLEVIREESTAPDP